MKFYFKLITLTILIMLSGCGESSKYPLDKMYWTAEDYKDVVLTIKYDTPTGEKYPTKESAVFQKLVNQQNFRVVLEDESLGVHHRASSSEAFFEAYRDLGEVYSQERDREDKFVYGEEIVDVLRFGLELQILYFKLGNQDILKSADDPNSSSVASTLSSNENTIVKNFENYLEYVNYEDGFSSQTLSNYAEGLDVSFKNLKETFPEADYSSLKRKAELMLKKSNNGDVQNSLKELISFLE